MTTATTSSNTSSPGVALAVVQFGDATLRLGTFNCGGLGGPATQKTKAAREKLINYCKNSKCLIVALQEARTDTTGKIQGDSAYYLESLGRVKDANAAKSDEGLAFFIKKSVQKPVVQSHGSGIASVRFKFNNVKIVFFNTYAPTCQSAADNRVASIKMYERLQTLVADELKKFDQIVIIGGDFNAFPDLANTGKYEPFIGNHVYGSSNSHGLILVNFLRATEIFHLNSRFEKNQGSKWTCLYKKNGTTKSELDGLISNRTDIVADVDTFPKKDNAGKDETDHRMVFSDWVISKPREEFSKKMRRIEKLMKSWEHFPVTIASVAGNTSDTQNWEFLKTLLNAMYVQASTVEIVKPIFKLLIENKKTNDSNLIIEAVEGHLERMYSEDGVKTIQPIQEGPENYVESLIAKTNNLSLEPISFSEEEIQNELACDVLNCMLECDHPIKKIIELGGDVLIKEATKLFNFVLSEGRVPSDWKTVSFKLPNQKNSLKPVEKYVFRGTIPWLGCVYSNLLARKLNLKLGGSVDVEAERSEKSAEIIITLTLLIEAFLATNKPLHFAVIEYSAYDRVSPSSILESLKARGAPKEYCDAFAELLQDVSMKLHGGKQNIAKQSGLHFGEAANYFLMDSVMKAIVKDCKDKWNREKVLDVSGPTNSKIDEIAEEFPKKLTISEGGSSPPTESSDNFDDSGIQADDSMVDASSETEESEEPRDDGQESVSTPENEEVSTAQIPNTEARGIKIGDNYLNILQWDNKVVLIDTNLENIETGLHDLSDASKKCGLLIDHKRVSLVTTMFSTDTTKLGDIEVKTVDASSFRLSYFGSESCKIAKKLCDAALMRKRFQDIAFHVTMPEFVLSKSAKEKLDAFKNKIIPLVFYNCEAWNSSAQEIQALQNFTNKILVQLEIKNYKFEVWKHIVHEKAKWLKDIAGRENSFCAKLLNTSPPGDVTDRPDGKWSRGLTSNMEKVIGWEVAESELISFIKEKPEEWDKLINDTNQV